MTAQTRQRSDPRDHFTELACATAPGIRAYCYDDHDGDRVFTMERDHVEALLDGRALRFYPYGVVVIDDVWFDDVGRDDSLLDEIADAASRLEELERRLDADDMNATRDEVADIRSDLVDAAVDRLVDWSSIGRGES